jgi:GNAT superfamily N-acetyltransferase
MTNEELHRRVVDLLVHQTRLFGGASEGSHVVEREGVIASIVPVAPDRSLLNGIVPNDAASLRRAYAELRALYEGAGVRAFTCWIDSVDVESRDFLEKQGHVLDARPRAMAAPIAELSLDLDETLDWRETDDLALIGALNDRAYGVPPPAFAAGLSRWPKDRGSWRAHLARHEGIDAATVMTFDAPNRDCGVVAVCALPEARGHRLATRLLSRALFEGKARGMTTTSLQSTTMGRPLYEKLGYRDLGELQMWELRVAR